ncbi:hypothetical protein ABT354_21905 [Streptomyces sp. NPDC000594]|uniref:hypothetical protein n=1 Tax=Streptomyces sp. NPDC000594 TaxID=3154261 RepID=UPI00332F260E
MSAPTQSTPDRTPECRQDACELCFGPEEIRLPQQAEAEAPVLTEHCGCGCHLS